MTVDDAELLALPAHERHQVMATLLAAELPAVLPTYRRRRAVFLGFVAFCVAVLAAWTVALGTTLPMSETTRQWRTAWVGFDVGLIAAFLVCGWAAWKGRQLLVPATLVTGALLLCDAWFDVVLSWTSSERWTSVLTAAFVEVPLAIALWLLARRLVLRGVSLGRQTLGLPETSASLSKLPLFDPLLVRGSRRAR